MIDIKYNPGIHHRGSVRLKGYDYSQSGMYFVTICTQNRESKFSKIENGVSVLSDCGNIVKRQLCAVSVHYSNIKLHNFVIMPNHIHTIFEIAPNRSPIPSANVFAQNPVGARFIAPNPADAQPNQGVINHAPTGQSVKLNWADDKLYTRKH
jgi:REP element-mobilizing transposase RayT